MHLKTSYCIKKIQNSFQLETNRIYFHESLNQKIKANMTVLIIRLACTVYIAHISSKRMLVCHTKRSRTSENKIMKIRTKNGYRMKRAKLRSADKPTQRNLL